MNEKAQGKLLYHIMSWQCNPKVNMIIDTCNFGYFIDIFMLLYKLFSHII